MYRLDEGERTQHSLLLGNSKLEPGPSFRPSQGSLILSFFLFLCLFLSLTICFFLLSFCLPVYIYLWHYVLLCLFLSVSLSLPYCLTVSLFCLSLSLPYFLFVSILLSRCLFHLSLCLFGSFFLFLRPFHSVSLPRFCFIVSSFPSHRFIPFCSYGFYVLSVHLSNYICLYVYLSVPTFLFLSVFLSQALVPENGPISCFRSRTFPQILLADGPYMAHTNKIKLITSCFDKALRNNIVPFILKSNLEIVWFFWVC